MVSLKGAVYFSATDPLHGPGLWRTDGTNAGTAFVADPAPGTLYDTGPLWLTPFGGELFFTARDRKGTRQLWRSDGTREGTVSVTDESIFSHPAFSGMRDVGPTNLVVVGRTLFFTRTEIGNARLWALRRAAIVPSPSR